MPAWIDYDGHMAPRVEPPPILMPESLVGTWRRFGVNGPLYEIVDLGQKLEGGDQVMRVKVVETGEELDYRFMDILDDPRER